VAAPVGGVVVGLSVVTVGGVVAPGELVMDIVPEGAELDALARVRPADRERLTVGMNGQVRLSAVEHRLDAALEGSVTRISLDRIEGGPDEEEGHYEMTISLPSGYPGASLVPGMPVTVVVPTEARTVIDYLLSPIRDAVARSMRKV
jgi:membrane fusion protein, epimerase transport system